MRHLIRIVATLCVATLAVGSTSMVMASASPPLSTQTISPSSLPSGWALENNGDNGVGCLHNLLEPAGIKQTSVARCTSSTRVSFRSSTRRSPPIPTQRRRSRRSRSTIAACHSPSGPFKGYQTTGTVTPLSYAKVASQSVAYQMVFKTSTNLTIYYDYVIARKTRSLLPCWKVAIPR